MTLRTDWSREEVKEIFDMPLLELAHRAASVHREYNDSRQVQLNRLVNIKVGGCSEDCSYCSQSSRYKTSVKAQPMMNKEEILEKARQAIKEGCSRLCMGAAWKQVRDNTFFERILETVKEVNGMGLEVCCTLGMLTKEQAQKLKEAGLYAYNHNIDTSENHYKNVITSHTFQDRIDTIRNVREAGLTVCCGGIMGIGEGYEDRIDFLHTLATFDAHPESIPINKLVPIEGTPLEANKSVKFWDLLRVVSTARILMPQTKVRMTAGRLSLSPVEQSMLFMAGVNSIFSGGKLLTTDNCEEDHDHKLLRELGLYPKEVESEPPVPTSCCQKADKKKSACCS